MTERPLKVAVFSQSSELSEVFRKCVPEGIAELLLVGSTTGEIPAGVGLAFIDGQWGGNLRGLLEQLSTQAIYSVVVDEESRLPDDVPGLLIRGILDDVLLVPIRSIEVLGKIKHAMHLMKVREVAAVNSDLKSLILKFDEDLRTARAVQRALIPEKFAPIHGMRVTHKYLSGLKSGGDYLDFFEFDDKMHVGMLLSDSTGYGLSSALMSVILKLAMRLSKDGHHSPGEAIAKIFEELRVTMKPKENLSLFYGIINRKTFELTYATCGTIQLVHQTPTTKLKDIPANGEPLTRDNPGVPLPDHRIQLHPEDRLVVFSDGFGDALASGGNRAAEQVFTTAYGEDAIKLINEMTYRIKSGLEAPDDLPEQDCSVMILDIEKRAMRLAR